MKKNQAGLSNMDTQQKQNAIDLAVIEKSGQFDPEYYLRTNPDVAQSGIDPLVHYVYYGAREGRNPTPHFDTTNYQATYPVLPTCNPFAHYLENIAAGNSGQGLDKQNITDPKIKAIIESKVFDIEYYLKRYPGCVRSAAYKAVDPEYGPINHYLKHGHNEKQNPSEHFDTSYYLAHNKDVAAQKVNPLLHYLTHGWKELRNPTKSFNTAWYWITHIGCDMSILCPLTHYIEIGAIEKLSTAPIACEKKVFDTNIEKAILDGVIGKDAALAICSHLDSAKFSDSIEKILRHLTDVYGKDCNLKNELAKFYAARGVWWQVVELLQEVSKSAPQDDDIIYRLGEAYEKMNNLEQAAEAFRTLTNFDQKKSLWHYRLGSIYRAQGKLNRAAASFKKAVAHDSDKSVKVLGIGAYDEARERWSEASDAYSKQIPEHPVSAELHYSYARALKNCYRWEEAADAFETAISLHPLDPAYYYYLAVCLEKQEKYANAGLAYVQASTRSKNPVSEWLYRAGLCLHKLGEYSEACKVFIKVFDTKGFDDISAKLIPPDVENCSAQSTPTDGAISRVRGLKRITDKYSSLADDYERLGDAYVELGLWQNAAESYDAACSRTNKHQPELYYKLGACLTALKRYECASEAFSWIYSLEPRLDIAKSASPSKTCRSLYAEYLKRPLLSKTIVYESYLGASLSCNPLAIYQALISNPQYADWTHVWVINDTAGLPLTYTLRKDTILIKRQSDAYARYLATASHLINNVTFPEWFIRRENQFYLNTWHGTPLKHMGHDVRDDFMAHKNVSRNFLQCTHLINPNRYTTDLMLSKHEVAGVYSGLIAETGYPRVDLILNRSQEDINQLRRKLDILDDKPIVLYAPTWRGLHGQVTVDVEQLEHDLEGMSGRDYHLIFRGHHFAEALIAGSNLPVSIAPHTIDTSDLLAVTDILITDYSSIFFDFLSTRKPIIFYTYDVEEYTRHRGLYIDHAELPGQICLDITSLKGTLESLLIDEYSIDRRHQKAIAEFAYLDDGSATNRVIDFFFEGEKSYLVQRYNHNKKSILFFPGSFIPNGITSSFLNLLNSIPSDEYSISLAVDPIALSSYPERMDKYAKIPPGIHTLARLGSLVMDEQEAWVLRRFTQTRNLESAEMWKVLHDIYQREYRRLYGHTKFDTIINFEGYSFFWSSLFALGKPVNANNILFMHSDMKSEYLIRHPYLIGLFNIYKNYDALISVSEKMRGINYENLGSSFGLPSEKFGYSINAINPDEILSRSQEEVDPDIAEWIGGSDYFITLGRLSPEKDQAKLIKSIAKVRNDFSSIKLVILGDGPLMGDLQRQVIDLGLEDSVMLAGLRENPFPLLRKAQCFVLSSNHEGQPMVLLESMVLGKPIIATDIDGNRGVLNGGYGELVENSVEGLAAGLKNFLKGDVRQRPFDAHAYMQKAIDMFAANIAKAEQNMESVDN